MSQIANRRPVASENRRESDEEAVLARVRESLNGLRFGTVTIVVQDGVVVQIDRTEKHRLRHSGD
jgi:hypothetical protein